MTEKYPRFCQRIRLGALDGPILTPKTIDKSVPWYWTGGASKAVKVGGKLLNLERAIFIHFSGETPAPRARVMRIKGTDPDDFNPNNFYCLNSSAAFDVVEEDEELTEFKALLDDMRVVALSEVDEIVWFDLSPDIIRQACQDVGVEIDVELEE